LRSNYQKKSKDLRKLHKETFKAKSFICLTAFLGKNKIPKAPTTGRQSRQKRIF
jgi:hypothetical protein